MRVVSLVPAATETVAALGLESWLVGVSHECDYPEAVRRKPHVTRSVIPGAGQSSAEIDEQVREALRTGGTLYTLDEPLMRELRPDVILSQRLCDVCAVAWGSVERFAAQLPGPPRLVNLEPTCLAELWTTIRHVSEVLGAPEAGNTLAAQLQHRVERVRERAAAAEARPRVMLLEWTSPPFNAGHWNPELVEIAGGTEVLGEAGRPSRSVTWDEIHAAAPEVLVIACCGYNVERTLEDMPVLRAAPGWSDLPAVRNNEVWVTDGNAFFARPGPRLVDSLEILAQIIQPELFAGWFPDRGARRIS